MSREGGRGSPIKKGLLERRYCDLDDIFLRELLLEHPTHSTISLPKKECFEKRTSVWSKVLSLQCQLWEPVGQPPLDSTGVAVVSPALDQKTASRGRERR